jgi:hypothetical protein
MTVHISKIIYKPMLLINTTGINLSVFLLFDKRYIHFSVPELHFYHPLSIQLYTFLTSLEP